MKYQELHFLAIDSTNDYVKAHHDELADLAVVSADYQSKGKGRNERSWLAKAGENLLFSLLVKNPEALRYGAKLSLVAAVIVAKTIESFGLADVSLKWPNDIYIHGKKTCGILLEGQLPNFIVIGIGININQAEFLGEYRHQPTSLSLELGKDIDIAAFKERLFNNLYEAFSSLDSLKPYLLYFRKHDFLLGKMVYATLNDEQCWGLIRGVDDEFRILFEPEGSGNIYVLSSGEIQFHLG